jgi:hypothetical protein
VDYNALAEGLEAAAASTGVRPFSEVPDSLPTWGFYVGEMDIDVNLTFGSRSGTRRGTDAVTVTCRVLVARYDDKQALKKLRGYMAGSGMQSLVQAIQADKTLGGSCDSSKVMRLSGNRMFDVGGTKYYGVELDVYAIGSA